MSFATIIISFLGFATTRAQNGTFKVEGQVDGTVMKVKVLNPPQGSAKVTLKRAQSGFNLSVCDGGGSTPVVSEGGFIVQANKTYCDLGVVAKNSYDYTAYSAPGQEVSQALNIGYLTTPTGGSTATRTLLPQSLDGAVEFLITWSVYRIGPGLVAMIIIFAGFQYIASHGNETVIKEAKDRIIKALIGLILLMLVGVIMRAVFL